MSENKNPLRIHARITPEYDLQADNTAAKVKRRNPLRIPPRRQRTSEPPEKLTFSDRLLRNSALACALLLAILSIGNINQPWARSASQSVEHALTMRIDLDKTIGNLSFVRDLMPESALVFLNLSGENELAQPVSGELTHSYSNAQPWLVFNCAPGSEVIAVADGTITAVSKLSGDTTGILIDHGGGLESVYAFLSGAAVSSGDTVQRGQIIGSSESSVYFELRENETSVDPAARMGL